MTGKQVRVQPDAAWKTNAACRTADSDLFFPDEDDLIGEAAAKVICGSCPVRSACLEWALATGEGHGVWGGLTERQRRSVARRRRA